MWTAPGGGYWREQEKASRKMWHCLMLYRRGAQVNFLWEAIGWASR